MWRNFAIVLVTLALAPERLPASDAADDSSLIVFLSAQGSQRFNADMPRGPVQGEGVADTLYTYSRGELRILSEVEVSTDDAELDRLQVGWELVPDTLVWLGKFHEPASPWSFGHDHGHYLQTAISIPSIETWDDNGGVLPENVTGVLFDSRRPTGTKGGIEVSFALGTAPNPVPQPDASYWVPTISTGTHRAGLSARFALLPDYASTNSFGLVAARHTLDTRGLDVVGAVIDEYFTITHQVQPLFDARAVNQVLYGAYADGDWGNYSLHATAYYVDLSLEEARRPRTESFIAGYVQLERRFADRYTLYGRHENASRAQESTYLYAIDGPFVVRRNLAGSRWDFARHQAITLEIERTTTLTNRFSGIGLQWSAVVDTRGTF